MYSRCASLYSKSEVVSVVCDSNYIVLYKQKVQGFGQQLEVLLKVPLGSKK